MIKSYRKIRIIIYKFRNSLVRFSDKLLARKVLFIHSLIDSIFFPISIDFLYIPLLLANPKKSYKFATIANIASIVGGIIAYLIGFTLMDSVGMSIVRAFNFESSWMELIEKYNSGYSLITLLVAAITPIPFSIASIASGATAMNFLSFLMISIFGRSLRFYFIAILVKNFRHRYLKTKTYKIAKYKGSIINNLNPNLNCIKE